MALESKSETSEVSGTSEVLAVEGDFGGEDAGRKAWGHSSRACLTQVKSMLTVIRDSVTILQILREANSGQPLTHLDAKSRQLISPL